MAPSAEVILMRTQAALLSSIHALHETNCTHVLAKAVFSVEPAECGQAVKLEMSNTPQFVMVLCQLDQLIAQTGTSCSGAYNDNENMGLECEVRNNASCISRVIA
jgi:hypothetical protein